MRSTDATIIHGEGKLCVFAKFSRFNLFAPLEGVLDSDFINTHIINGNGTFLIPQHIHDEDLGSFYINRSIEIGSYALSLSDEQKNKIAERAKKNMDKIIGSDLHKAMKNKRI